MSPRARPPSHHGQQCIPECTKERQCSLTFDPEAEKVIGSWSLYAAPSSVWMDCFASSPAGEPSASTSTPAPLIMLYIISEPSFSPSALDAVAGSRLMPANIQIIKSYECPRR